MEHQQQTLHNMDILFILIDDKLDAHYIISEDVDNKEIADE